MTSDQEDFTKYREALNELRFEAKVMKGINRMTLHVWRKAGIIEDNRDPESKTKWNFYSPLDVVLIGILNQMKQLRFTHAEMKACKNVLFESIKVDNDKELPALEHYTTLVLIHNQPIYIVITYDKGIDAIYLLDEQDYFVKLRTGEIENHTALCLHKIVKVVLTPVYKLPDFSQTAALTKDEIKILQIIRSKTFKTIKVIKRNGDIDSIEGVERIEDLDRIEKLIESGAYQNMEIKQQNGKIVSAHRTIRSNFTRK